MHPPGDRRVKAVFVTGTDTACGKTRVGVTLARLARKAGLRVRVCKPIETGCELRDGVRQPADALALAAAAEDPRPLERVCPYRLALPAAPEVAARHEHLTIELERLREAFDDARADADLVLVEGAGGLRVAIAPGLDMARLARELALPVLLVARAALGTMNHTRLTLEALATEGLALAGVVVSHTAPGLSDADRANLDRLLEDLPGRFLGELEHGAAQLRPPLDVQTWLDSLVTA